MGMMALYFIFIIVFGESINLLFAQRDDACHSQTGTARKNSPSDYGLYSVLARTPAEPEPWQDPFGLRFRFGMGLAQT
jgi:hypothetical protein